MLRIVETADLHPTQRDDNIHCGQFADENLNWDFDGHRGWCRTTCTGGRWRRYGPLDEWGRAHLLRYFGLDAPAIAALYPLERLQTLPPQALRSAARHVKGLAQSA